VTGDTAAAAATGSRNAQVTRKQDALEMADHDSGLIRALAHLPGIDAGLIALGCLPAGEPLWRIAAERAAAGPHGRGHRPGGAQTATADMP
jgi:hypothetical protein